MSALSFTTATKCRYSFCIDQIPLSVLAVGKLQELPTNLLTTCQQQILCKTNSLEKTIYGFYMSRRCRGVVSRYTAFANVSHARRHVRLRATYVIIGLTFLDNDILPSSDRTLY